MKNNEYSYFNPSIQKHFYKQNPSFSYDKSLKNESYPINYNIINSINKLPSSNINVFCRFHPINELEYLYSNKEGIIIKSSTNLSLKEKKLGKLNNEYIFKEIFDKNIHITSFYNRTCKSIVNAIIQGYNGGIILYGDTSLYKKNILKEIIPQIINQIYQNISLSYNDNELFKTELAIYEIFNEKIINLIREINSSDLNKGNEDKDEIIYKNCYNENDMEAIINNGLNKKDENGQTFESHLVIEIKIFRYDKRKNLLRYGKLYLINLETQENDVTNNNSVLLTKKKMIIIKQWIIY